MWEWDIGGDEWDPFEGAAADDIKKNLLNLYSLSVIFIVMLRFYNVDC